MDILYINRVAKGVGLIGAPLVDSELNDIYQLHYKPNIHQRLAGHYKEFSVENAFDMRDENGCEAKEMIESKVEKVYSILSGKGPRAWWRRIGLINDIVNGGPGCGLIADIENALTEGLITKEYASMTTNYIKDLMRDSMTENRSFKRALQGSVWEQKAEENILVMDMIMDEYGLQKDSEQSKAAVEYGIKTEMLDSDINELEEAIIISFADIDKAQTTKSLGSTITAQAVDDEITSGYLSWLPHSIGRWITNRKAKAA